MAILLSYSRNDEQVVTALAQGLAAARRQVWFDHDLGGGDAWWDSILENVRSATVFLFALSDASLQSKPCRLELDYARALDRPIVPVQVGLLTSLRSSAVSDLQIISYSPDDARSGFTVLAAVDDAAARVRPLPDPLPPPPPIPFAYLLVLGRQIESEELSQSVQLGIVEQLRRAIGEETDESVRRDILSIAKNLDSKPWTTKRTAREIEALLYANDPVSQHDEGRGDLPLPTRLPDGPKHAESEAPPETSPRQRPQPDAFAERPDQPQKQQTIEEPPTWRPPPDAAGRWREAFEQDEHPSRPADLASSPGSMGRTSTPTSGFPTPFPPPYFAAPASEHSSPPTVTQPPARQPAPPAQWASRGGASTGPPPNYWAMSIASFLFNLLFGAIAIYFSHQVGQRYKAGDMEGARKASVTAKRWGIAGIVTGLVLLIALLWAQS